MKRSPMKDASITVRLPQATAKRLARRAREEGQAPSTYVRHLIDEDLAAAMPPAATAYELTERWVGSVCDATLPAGHRAREALDAWKPDRRGSS